LGYRCVMHRTIMPGVCLPPSCQRVNSLKC